MAGEEEDESTRLRREVRKQYADMICEKAKVNEKKVEVSNILMYLKFFFFF